MAEGRWTVLAICSERGDCAVATFLEGLEGKLAPQAERMWTLIDLVARDGPPRNTDISHKLSEDIWELIRGDLRVLWFYDDGRVVVCSHGIVKKRQKTSRADITHAETTLARFRAAKRAGRVVVDEEKEPR